ncbi:MAG: hypothetical protein WA610_10195 [Thermodesulfovibrionales bacterium]
MAIMVSTVFARYAICCLPLWLLFISAGLHKGSLKLGTLAGVKDNCLQGFSSVVVIVFLLAAFLKGPLLSVYTWPNNFTNHSDFQEDYRYTWTRADLNSLHNPIPRFYFYLKDVKKASILEYPYFISWLGNNYHIYQKLHRKAVMIGHTSQSYLVQKDPVMHPNIALTNFVNIENPGEIVRSGCSFVVVHKDMLREFLFMRDNFADLNRRIDYVDYVRKHREGYDEIVGSPSRNAADKAIASLKNSLGNPIYEDNLIVVFEVK